MDFHPIVQNRFKRAALSYKFVVKNHFRDVIIKTSDLEETNLAKKIMKIFLRYEKNMIYLDIQWKAVKSHWAYPRYSTGHRIDKFSIFVKPEAF